MINEQGVRAKSLVLAAIVIAMAVPVAGQGVPCPEFQVNTSTPFQQWQPAVAADARGGFVVVWQGDDASGLALDVFGQRFSPSAERRGGEFRVNTFTFGHQVRPSIAIDGAGGFVVVWESLQQVGIRWNVFGQRFDAAGVPQGLEFQVNAASEMDRYWPQVASAGNGDFVVVWSAADGEDQRVFARLFAASGTPRGPEFPVSANSLPRQGTPSVAVAPGGDFMVAWSSSTEDENDVVARRFDAAGVPQGPDFRLNSTTTGVQREPAVASDASGNFVVVWSSSGQDGPNFGVFGQRFDAAGDPQGPEFRANTYTVGDQTVPAVAADPQGRFVVVWTSDGQDGSGYGMFGQRFDAQGSPQGSEFRLNVPTARDQFWGKVAPGANGGFVYAWTGDEQDGSSRGVAAGLDCARFYPVPACRIADTRGSPGPSGGPALQGNSTRAFPASGLCGVPADARAVALNVTAVNPSDLGDLLLYRAGEPAPLASTLDFAAGRTRANSATVPLGADGRIAVQCHMPAGATGSTDLVLDVYGYFKR